MMFRDVHVSYCHTPIVPFTFLFSFFDLFNVCKMLCCSYVISFHSSVLGSDFGLLDGQQVGSCYCDHRTATAHTDKQVTVLDTL